MEVWVLAPRKLLFTGSTCASIRGARGPSTGVNNHRRPNSMIKAAFSIDKCALYIINLFNNVSYNNLHVSLVYRGSLGALCVLPLPGHISARVKPNALLFTPTTEGWSLLPLRVRGQKIHVSDMYRIRYRCISCEHVVGMVSPSKIHHDTSEGAERKKG